MNKPWYLSKTLWVNAITMVIAIINANMHFLPVEWTTYGVAVVSALNVILRLLTGQPIVGSKFELAAELGITTNPHSYNPLNFNGDVRIMPNLGMVDLYGTITGNLLICQGSSLHIPSGHSLSVSGNITTCQCSTGGQGGG